MLCIPGFSAGDNSNFPLAAVIRTNGCRPAKSGLPRNEGPSERVLRRLDQRLEHLAEVSGRRVSVVGVSLGGVFARRLARRYPELVRQVVTIGSPIRFDDDQRGGSRLVTAMWNRSASRFDPAAMEELQQREETKAPLTVPATSIHSRLDGVVPWVRSLDEPGELSENIEVRGASHVGLIVHPGVHLVLADRIRQREGEWRPFRIPSGAGTLIARAEAYDHQRARRPA
ncbi:MAG: alpha/beta fold hydrolase [Desertimonas sp.]